MGTPASVALQVTPSVHSQGPNSALPSPMRAATRMNCPCPQGRACACWKHPTAAGGCAGEWGRGWSWAQLGAGQDPGLAKLRPPHRFGRRSGLLPAVRLRPEGLGALLSRPGLHREANGEIRVGEAQGSPETSQAATLPPTVPARPTLSAIQSRCCTVTRRALLRKDPLEGVWNCAEGKPNAPDPGED